MADQNPQFVPQPIAPAQEAVSGAAEAPAGNSAVQAILDATRKSPVLGDLIEENTTKARSISHTFKWLIGAVMGGSVTDMAAANVKARRELAEVLNRAENPEEENPLAA